MSGRQLVGAERPAMSHHLLTIDALASLLLLLLAVLMLTGEERRRRRRRRLGTMAMSRMPHVRRRRACLGGGVMGMAAVHTRPVGMVIRRVRRRRHLLSLYLLLLSWMLSLLLALGMSVRMMIPSPPGGVGDVPSVVMIVSRRGRGCIVLLRMDIRRAATTDSDGGGV